VVFPVVAFSAWVNLPVSVASVTLHLWLVLRSRWRYCYSCVAVTGEANLVVGAAGVVGPAIAVGSVAGLGVNFADVLCVAGVVDSAVAVTDVAGLLLL
jgi:hypothetical protein